MTALGAGLVSVFAGSVRPRPRVRPSEWAARNIVLPGKLSGRPGPFNIHFKPWTRATLDVRFEHPGKKGCVTLKPAQCGFSTATLIKVLCAADTDPGPIYYMTTDKDKAREFSQLVFMGLVQGSPRLARLFGEEVKDEAQTSYYRSFPGGGVRFVGAGSGGAVTSWPERDVYLDEYELAARNFAAAGMGDLFQSVLPRTATYRDTAWVEAFAHPNMHGSGIAALYDSHSTRTAWAFDCPRCAAPVAPLWEHVHSGNLALGAVPLDAEAAFDPAAAALRCPACGEPISDAERAAAVWEPARGGSGRFVGEEADAGREFVGRAIHALCDPAVGVASLAAQWARLTTLEERHAFYTLVLGEPYKLVSGVVTLERVDACLARQAKVLLPAPPRGVHFMTAGVDVQAPRENPTMYTSLVAWAASGHAYVCDMRRLTGWAALFEFLAGSRFLVEGGAWIEPLCCGIDCGAWTGEVLSASREIVHAHASGARVRFVPLRYQTHVKADLPYVMPADRKRVDPSRPHLGMLDRYDLHRETFVDRAMRRWIDGRLTVLCEPPENLRSHITANVRRPKQSVHGLDDAGEEWDKIKGGRDDWLQSLAYAEAVAVIALRLDTLHTRIRPLPPAPPQAKTGYWDRFPMRRL